MDYAKQWDEIVSKLAAAVAERGFSDIVLGLSGGIDSALVAALAADALGKTHVHGFMLSSQYTSDLSKKAAKELAQKLQISFTSISIEPVFKAYMETFTKAFDKVSSLTCQNIQARIRGNLLMAYSNQYNWLTLCCGNKSEAMMGYCTLYGDTVGALAPLGNIYKTEVYKLAEYRNSVSDVIPLDIIRRAPTAELYEGQTDEDSLPPYDVLDNILTRLYDQKENVANVAALFPSALVDEVVKRHDKFAYKRAYLPPAL